VLWCSNHPIAKAMQLEGQSSSCLCLCVTISLDLNLGISQWPNVYPGFQAVDILSTCQMSGLMFVPICHITARNLVSIRLVLNLFIFQSIAKFLLFFFPLTWFCPSVQGAWGWIGRRSLVDASIIDLIKVWKTNWFGKKLVRRSIFQHLLGLFPPSHNK